MKKFTMELVWHNCKTHPPSEDFNDDLIVTNGNYVFDMSWFRDKGYFIATIGCNDLKIEDSVLENWWWADIQQTVQGEPRFKHLIIDDLVGLFDKGGEFGTGTTLIGSKYDECIKQGF